MQQYHIMYTSISTANVVQEVVFVTVVDVGTTIMPGVGVCLVAVCVCVLRGAVCAVCAVCLLLVVSRSRA